MKILPHVLSVVAILAFANGAWAVENESLAQAQMKLALRSYFDAMNAHETQKLINMFSADGMIDDPAGRRSETPKQFFTRLANTKFTFEIAELTATGANTAAAALHIHGINRNTIRNGTLHAIEIFTFESGGKISSMKAYWGDDDLTSP